MPMNDEPQLLYKYDKEIIEKIIDKKTQSVIKKLTGGNLSRMNKKDII